MLFRATYHRSLREIIGRATIEVPDDAATPHEDAAAIARQAGAECAAVFFTLLRERGTSPTSPALHTDESVQVYWTNARL